MIQSWENAWNEFVPFPRVPGRASQDRLHDERRRVLECPFPSRCPSPRALPKRAGRAQGHSTSSPQPDGKTARTLEQLVWQLINSGKPRMSHTFPMCGKEPSEGFAVEMHRKRREKRGVRYDPLFGLATTRRHYSLRNYQCYV
jgi:hypothetical protein